MSELDKNIKKVLKHFNVDTIEEAIEGWNQVNRDMYQLFNCVTLPISKSKSLVVVLQAVKEGLTIDKSHGPFLQECIDTLNRQLKPYRMEQDNNA